VGERRLILAAAALLAVACAPKLDPLAALKEELGAHRATEPQATVVLDDEALSAMAGELLGRPHTAPGPLGMAVVIMPEVERSQVKVQPDDDAVSVEMEVDGAVDIAFPLASQDDLAFEGVLRAPVVASVRPDPRGSWVLLGWAPNREVVAQVQLPGSSEQLASLTTGLVQGALAGALREPKGALVPMTPWGPITDVALDARGDDLLAHVTVAGAPGSLPEPVDPPPHGFAVVVSEASVLGLLQGLAASSQDRETYVVEPIALTFEGDIATAELRVHKRARKERWRRYRVTGPMRWDAGSLRVDAPQLELVEHRGWRKGVSVAIGEARAVSSLQKGIGGLPTALAQPLTADLALYIEVDDVSASSGQLVVSGPVSVRARASE